MPHYEDPPGEALAAAMHEPPMPRAAGKSIELFVIDETQLPGAERKPWRAAEI